jgi:hypothetical protein
MSPPSRKVYPIGATELRKLFNAQNFTDRLLRGEVFEERVKSQPADRSRNLPPGTLSILSEYFDGQHNFIAQVHYYQPRGKPKTRPDPKQLVIGDTHYVLLPNE